MERVGKVWQTCSGGVLIPCPIPMKGVALKDMG